MLSVGACSWVEDHRAGFCSLLKEMLQKSLSFNTDGFLPRNPCGRTGLTGRGLLGRWGPNHAADPIVTR